ncbi:hypothetical protein F4556_000411 [Kitasatospora gansuensis]|uniref:Uncharacterized protein n=1 Tax=Kitasatospora gansuensis TaxID=258050 RepID=A0A7W7S8I5_9ACTN|nr:hypothetical protein [Kitasatospora gansuensis]MBB4944876.1 hypothetical protein [Kitasatospora gansuensis]
MVSKRRSGRLVDGRSEEDLPASFAQGSAWSGAILLVVPLYFLAQGGAAYSALGVALLALFATIWAVGYLVKRTALGDEIAEMRRHDALYRELKRQHRRSRRRRGSPQDQFLTDYYFEMAAFRRLVAAKVVDDSADVTTAMLVASAPVGPEAEAAAQRVHASLENLFARLGPPPDAAPDDGTWGGGDAPPGVAPWEPGFDDSDDHSERAAR